MINIYLVNCSNNSLIVGVMCENITVVPLFSWIGHCSEADTEPSEKVPVTSCCEAVRVNQSECSEGGAYVWGRGGRGERGGGDGGDVMWERPSSRENQRAPRLKLRYIQYWEWEWDVMRKTVRENGACGGKIEKRTKVLPTSKLK